MAMISFRHKGSFKKTLNFLEHARNLRIEKILDRYGTLGVEALRKATPVDSGLTSNSWDYQIEHSGAGLKLIFTNSNIQSGYANIAILLQHGHGTGTGGYVQGRDYINPAIRPIFDDLANSLWEEVVRHG